MKSEELVSAAKHTLLKNHKDSVFRLLFNDKEHALELYNALSGTNYGPDTPVEFTTLEEVMMKTKKNDISFLLEDIFIIMLEHQSTLSGNLPVRYLLYFATTIQRMFTNREFYKAKGFKIPRPVFIVLYNGPEETEDKFLLHLEDNFRGEGKSNLQLEVVVYNINKGRNQEIMEQSKTLAEYVMFIEKIRSFTAASAQPLTDADLAKLLKECIDEGILTDFLTQYGVEVISMLFEEMTQEEAVDLAREDGYEEGRELGREEGKMLGKMESTQAIARNMKASGMPIAEIACLTELSPEEVEQL